MSVAYNINVTVEDLVAFLANEYKVDSGIPIHVFSSITTKAKGFTDNVKGCFYETGPRSLTAYGDNDFVPLFKTLRACGVKFFDAD